MHISVQTVIILGARVVRYTQRRTAHQLTPMVHARDTNVLHMPVLWSQNFKMEEEVHHKSHVKRGKRLQEMMDCQMYRDELNKTVHQENIYVYVMEFAGTSLSENFSGQTLFIPVVVCFGVSGLRSRQRVGAGEFCSAEACLIFGNFL